MKRTDAARIGGMDRQTLRDWDHRFNAHSPDGLLDGWSKGPEPRLSAEQRAEIADLVETGPDRVVHGVVRWRRIDLRRVIFERFGVAYHERTTGKVLKTLGFSHISARPHHPKQDERTNRVFETYEHIIEAACDAWRRLIAQPQTITSIGSRKWAVTGQT